MTDDHLAEELARRAALDQEVLQRRSAEKESTRKSGAGGTGEWELVRQDNTEWLKAVIAEHGWPGRTLVGDHAAEAAWLLAQHSDQQPEFQRHCVRLLRQAVQEDQAPAWCLAYLDDRVRVAEGRTQLYGTQYRDGVPYPVEDPDGLDERRVAVGLEPHADYDRLMRKSG
ncbi:DUF6624 domain-containing protein [Actinomadura violacea]|uniref:Uncharacterized protein n=1 Tax=Actinomadura violacea TaxID=2819934 RepID=A0ABS3S7J3_9ACTN|nr:DUF6624 domain-containing protein [Actinomadura violacea]MBO2464974.1 hypothetical protein [Actinomadura violacea]